MGKYVEIFDIQEISIKDLYKSPMDLLSNLQIYLQRYHFKSPNIYLQLSQDILPFLPSLSCRPATAAGIGPTMCAHLDDPYGSLHAHHDVWPQGTTFGCARLPLRQVRLQCHRRPDGLQQLLGCCHGPEAWRSSTRPVWTAWTRSLGFRGLFLAALHH